ncbi:MAG: hypothetical protein K2F68_00415 [Duncaniella sp.]|nr:hypothetical protein [Duncaniella sp.]MDE6169602.1 hypothetical protein [Duncaniella sp.]
MKRLSLITIIIISTLLILPSNANAQVKRGEWDFRPVLTTTNSLYGLLFNGAGTIMGSSWVPSLFNRFSVMQSLHTPEGKASIKYWDWEFRNIAVAYQVAYQGKFHPFGFSFRVGYEKRGLQTNLPDKSKKYFNRQMIAPTFLLNVRFGNYLTNRVNPVLEIGGSYDVAIACKGLSKNTKSVNNGFHGIAGIGFGDTNTHLQWTLRYEQDFYNWFNEDFTTDNGNTHPYKGWKSKMGYLSISCRFGF